MADEFSRLERRIRDLEANRGAVLRWGTVTGVDEREGSAKVQISDAENFVSMPLRVLQRRTLKDQHQELPDLGEQVACLFAGQGPEQGLVLGAVYSTKDPAPGKPPQVWYRRFQDGTELEYDRQAHSLSIAVNGDISIRASGVIKLNAAQISVQED